MTGPSVSSYAAVEGARVLIGRRIADRAVLDVDVVVAGPAVAPVNHY
jgi:hypothetical protein